MPGSGGPEVHRVLLLIQHISCIRFCSWPVGSMFMVSIGDVLGKFLVHYHIFRSCVHIGDALIYGSAWISRRSLLTLHLHYGGLVIYLIIFL